MTEKKKTPLQKARSKYEVVHKEARAQASRQYHTRMPTEEYEEIVAFLKKYGIGKIDLIRIGYETLKQQYNK